MTQLKFFVKDVRRMLGKRKIRVLHVWLGRCFWGVFMYRFERSLYLLVGKSYGIIRVPFIPLLNLLNMYSNIDIHYKAKIEGGLIILHPSVGCVVSGQVSIGKNLTLTGGNVIGIKKSSEQVFVIGDNCTLGANATVIGPLQLADGIVIGASACVTKSFLDEGSVLVGVPAKVWQTT